MKTPLGLTELTVDRLYGRGADGRPIPDPALAALSSALRGARQIAEQLAHAAETTLRDETQTRAARLAAVRARALEAGERAGKVLDKARDAAVLEAERLEQQTRCPPTSSKHAPEIRAWLAGMSEEARSKEIADAIKSGDDRILAAVLDPDAPAGLSGLSNSEFDLRQAEFRARRFPQESARFQRLRTAIRRFEKAGDTFFGFADSLARDPAAEMAAENAAAAEEARKNLEGAAA